MSKTDAYKHLALVITFATIACTQPERHREGPQVHCDRIAMASILTMPDLGTDSASIRTFEIRIGSRIKVPGRIYDGKYYTPKAQFPNKSWQNSHITELVFNSDFHWSPNEYNQYIYPYMDEMDGSGGNFYDGIDVAKKSQIWHPVFYRPSPIPGLNMLVAHSFIDSAYFSFTGWRPVPKNSVVKLYNRDAIMDSLFPDLRIRDGVDKNEFRSLFNCLQAHFDSLYQNRYSEVRVLQYQDLGRDVWAFHDKPFRDLIRYHTWLTPDSVAIKLYCFPADNLRKYYHWGGTSDLLFDSLTCTYRRVPQGTTSAVDNAMDIQWDDLAIWIVYTDIRKRSNFHEP